MKKQQIAIGSGVHNCSLDERLLDNRVRTWTRVLGALQRGPEKLIGAVSYSHYMYTSKYTLTGRSRCLAPFARNTSAIETCTRRAKRAAKVR